MTHSQRFSGYSRPASRNVVVGSEAHITEGEGRRKVFSLIKDIRVSMMATYAPEGFMHARPMVARVE